ncbi:HlyD family secretion protein [Nubsella zeaxanthinifaciens]|uniref:HlyD family secretion protein n=1 Tax=Nubsella zeaxanthinifaciens TaxID=392412 RepID=UPI001F2924D8|nr:HlyD family efflux transporter periplasmic adaptor subunit [Nubsella zeaxanthinifaciens]
MINISENAIAHLHQTRVRSQLIYIVVLLAVAATFVSLPFIYTSVSVKGQGILQSGIEKVELLSPANGRLISVNLKDNQKVKKGEKLLILDAGLPAQQNQLLDEHTNDLNAKLSDAKNLLKNIQIHQLKTAFYQASWQEFQTQLVKAKIETDQAFRIYQRYQILYNKQAVTLAEYEQYKFNYEHALSGQEILQKKYRSQWNNEANQWNNELRDLKNQQVQLREQEKQYTLKATIDGSIQNLTGLQVGAFIYANQKIGEISPDSALVAFCYVKPSDIGLIKKFQEVRFQIDAFNYNQWGVVTGKVIDISDDVIVQNQTPFFKVKCVLDKDYLQLKNGYKGYIKKGMTFNANFLVAKRSLYQLLYDKADNWLNPKK